MYVRTDGGRPSIHPLQLTAMPRLGMKGDKGPMTEEEVVRQCKIKVGVVKRYVGHLLEGVALGTPRCASITYMALSCAWCWRVVGGVFIASFAV